MKPVNAGPIGKIKAGIRDKIGRGSWRPGSKIASVRQLADQFDVSISTVQRALRDLIKEGVVESVHGSGTYVAEQTVRLDVNIGNKHVLLVVPNFPEIDSLKDAALKEGIFISYYNSREDQQSAEAERRILETAIENGIYHAVVCPSPNQPTNEDFYRQLRQRGMRLLLVGHYREAMQDEFCLLPDFRQVGFNAAVKLALCGYRPLMLLERPEQAVFLNLIRQGFEDAVAFFGIENLPAMGLDIPRGTDDSFSQKELASLSPALVNAIGQWPERTGIVLLFGQERAHAIAELIRAQGRQIPEEIGLISAVAHASRFPISCCYVDREAMLMEAIKLVLDCPAGDNGPRLFRTWPPVFTEGETVASV